MKTSVLIATYNGADYIIEQLDSIRNQSINVDEVVIVDDCSADDTVDIVESFIMDYQLSSWRVIRNTKNKGWKNNFFEGIIYTSGDIVFFCDQDDIWMPHKIAIEIEILKTNPNINVVCSDKIDFRTIESPSIFEVKKYEIERVQIGCGHGNLIIRSIGATMCFRREYFNRIRDYHLPMMAHDDFFWKAGVIDGCLIFIKNPTVLRRVHKSNASLMKRNKKMTLIMIEEQIATVLRLLEYVKDETSGKRDVMRRFIRGNEIRIEMIKGHMFINVIRLMPYCSDIYGNLKTLLGDIMISVFPRWRM